MGQCGDLIRLQTVPPGLFCRSFIPRGKASIGPSVPAQKLRILAATSGIDRHADYIQIIATGLVKLSGVGRTQPVEEHFGLRAHELPLADDSNPREVFDECLADAGDLRQVIHG